MLVRPLTALLACTLVTSSAQAAESSVGTFFTGSELAQYAAAASAQYNASASVAYSPAARVASGPRAPWLAQDPGDSLYRAGREALNQNNYRQAANLFRSLRSRYPRSGYTPDAYYWEAFARFRLGGNEELRTARDLLREQGRRYPDAGTRTDASSLAARIQGALAQQGDSRAAENVVTSASSTSCGEETEMQVAALNALLQMDSERAVPILKRILARRDACSVELRERALFLVSQKKSPEAQAILLDVVRSDPEQQVREKAVFWLSAVPGDATVAVLDSVLRNTKDKAIKEKAVFALSQHKGERASLALRRLVEDESSPDELRANAIFWLGQRKGDESGGYMRDLYATLKSRELKERVLFSVAQNKTEENRRWLMTVVRNQRESVELRKMALFWAGQGGLVPAAELGGLYDEAGDREMREQIIFVLSQNKEPAAVEKMIDIAKREKDGELRKRAVFWLGQSKDPRATRFLEDLLMGQ